MLICRPKGRGNWRTVVITIDRPADMFVARKNALITLGHWRLRIVKVLP